MPLTPTEEPRRQIPTGLPQNLMDDFVPVSPAFPRDEEEEDAGWGEMSREEAKAGRVEESDDEGEMVGRREALIDLDEVAREEIDVWGDRRDD